MRGLRFLADSLAVLGILASAWGAIIGKIDTALFGICTAALFIDIGGRLERLEGKEREGGK